MILRGETKKFRKRERRKSQDKSILTFPVFYGIIYIEKNKNKQRFLETLTLFLRRYVNGILWLLS